MANAMQLHVQLSRMPASRAGPLPQLERSLQLWLRLLLLLFIYISKNGIIFHIAIIRELKTNATVALHSLLSENPSSISFVFCLRLANATPQRIEKDLPIRFASRHCAKRGRQAERQMNGHIN